MTWCMKTKLLFYILLFAHGVSFAGSFSVSGSGGPVVTVALPQPKKISLSITVRADFVSVPIRLTSDQKNAAVAYEESKSAIESVFKQVKEHGHLRASMGVTTLGQAQSGFGVSSGGWKQPAAVSELYLLVRLTKEHNDLFSAAAEAARFVERLRLPAKMTCDLGKAQLAIENPEQHRAELLREIAEQIKSTRESLRGVGAVKVDGLESPVIVRQADERNVELYLNYSVSASIEVSAQ